MNKTIDFFKRWVSKVRPGGCLELAQTIATSAHEYWTSEPPSERGPAEISNLLKIVVAVSSLLPKDAELLALRDTVRARCSDVQAQQPMSDVVSLMEAWSDDVAQLTNICAALDKLGDHTLPDTVQDKLAPFRTACSKQLVKVTTGQATPSMPDAEGKFVVALRSAISMSTKLMGDWDLDFVTTQPTWPCRISSNLSDQSELRWQRVSVVGNPPIISGLI